MTIVMCGQGGAPWRHPDRAERATGSARCVRFGQRTADSAQLRRRPADQRFVTAAITELAFAADAARAAASLLPATTPLSVGEPSQQADAVPLDGQAIYARFTGAAEGHVAVVV